MLRIIRRFTLSNLLLATALIAIGVGWIVDSKFREREFDRELREYTCGAKRFTQIHSGNSTAEAFKEQSHEVFSRRIDMELFGSVRNSWCHEAEIDRIGRDFNSASFMAKKALRLLNCETAQDFFELSDRLYPRDYGFFPEIHDHESMEHESFKLFIEKALQLDDQIPD